MIVGKIIDKDEYALAPSQPVRLSSFPPFLSSRICDEFRKIHGDRMIERIELYNKILFKYRFDRCDWSVSWSTINIYIYIYDIECVLRHGNRQYARCIKRTCLNNRESGLWERRIEYARYLSLSLFSTRAKFARAEKKKRMSSNEFRQHVRTAYATKAPSLFSHGHADSFSFPSRLLYIYIL